MTARFSGAAAVLMAAVALLAARPATSQSLTVLHSFFTAFQAPETGLIQGPDNFLYGTLSVAGGANGGAIFKVDTAGNLTILHTFDFDDGDLPSSTLTRASDGLYYGTTAYGGASGMGTVFKIDSTGVFTLLHSFTGADGANPYGRLFEATDGKLYGTTQQGGTGLGTVYRIDGTGAFASLHSFAGNGSEGGYPVGGVTQAPDGKLYGSGQTGGTGGIGVVFQMTTAGTLVNIHSFAASGLEGVSPSSALLLLADGKLYGTATTGGANAKGCVFRVDTSGNLSVLKSFTGSDGDQPYSDLFLGSDGKLYGTTFAGGTNDAGTVYRLDPAGTNFVSLHPFAPATEGRAPRGRVIQAADSNFYGTASDGGSATGGAVFKMTSGGTVTTVYAFGAAGIGHEPSAALAAGSDGKLYGTTYRGGAANKGAAFKIDTAGVYTSLHVFAGNEPGSTAAALTQASDGNFYGASAAGGTGDLGTLFRLTSGGAVTTLHSFADTDGTGPLGGLVQGSDGNLYGTTYAGGGTSLNLGTTLKIAPAGTGFADLHDFAGPEGALPRGKLIQATDGNYYGTTESGGASPMGNVYRMTAAGVVTPLHTFAGTDGMWPFGGVIQASDGKFYGTTRRGGDNDVGTVFRMDSAGNVTTLRHLGQAGDGFNPYGELVVGADGALYGTTYSGGLYGKGTIFRVTLAGSFSTVHDFSGPDGSGPPAGLVKGADNALYGVTNRGGLGAAGVVFRLSTCVPPVATITAPGSVCASTPGNAASVPDAGPGATYAWTIGNGTITAGAGTRAITFTAGASGSVSLSVTVTPAGGCPPAMGSTSISISTLCPSNLSFYTLAPCRLVDTRNANGPLGGPALAANATRPFVPRGTCGIPVGAKAVALNVAVTLGTATGNLTVYPAGTPLPVTSTINYGAGKTRANSAIVTLGASGDVAVRCSQASGTVHLILDVTGYFQ